MTKNNQSKPEKMKILNLYAGIDRKCTICGNRKPLEDFYGDASKPLGKSYKCIKCAHRYYREVRYPKKRHSEKYKEQHKEYSALWIAKNKDKAKAHQLAQKVQAKPECEHCGSTGKLHKHHPDYSKPLEVITLCIPCHEIVHHGVRT